DEAAKPADWLAATDTITQRNNVSSRPGHIARTPNATPGMRGEILRTHQSPTVFELIAKRMTDPRIDLRGACALAQMLDLWDPRPALPLITQQLARAIQASQ